MFGGAEPSSEAKVVLGKGGSAAKRAAPSAGGSGLEESLTAMTAPCTTLHGGVPFSSSLILLAYRRVLVQERPMSWAAWPLRRRRTTPSPTPCCRQE